MSTVSSALPRRFRGWWHYSHLVYWHVATLTIGTVCGVGTTTALTASPGRTIGTVLTVLMATVLLALLATGAARAERARRYGCW